MQPLLPLLPLPPLATPRSGEPPEDELVVAPPESFTREFEGKVEARPLGAIPEVAILHGVEATEEEPEHVWVLPSPELLDTVSGKRERLEKEVQATAALIASTLASFSIQARVVGANSGPTVTQYELQPAAGVPVRKIVGAQTDLSLALAAPIRIQPFIPGKSAVGHRGAQQGGPARLPQGDHHRPRLQRPPKAAGRGPRRRRLRAPRGRRPLPDAPSARRRRDGKWQVRLHQRDPGGIPAPGDTCAAQADPD